MNIGEYWFFFNFCIFFIKVLHFYHRPLSLISRNEFFHQNKPNIFDLLADADTSDLIYSIQNFKPFDDNLIMVPQIICPLDDVNGISNPEKNNGLFLIEKIINENMKEW